MKKLYGFMRGSQGAVLAYGFMQVSQAFSLFCTTPILLRQLGAAAFGIWLIYKAILEWIWLARWGIDGVMHQRSREIVGGEDAAAEVYWRGVLTVALVSLAMAGLIIGGAPWISSIFLDEGAAPTLTHLLRWTVVPATCSALMVPLEALVLVRQVAAPFYLANGASNLVFAIGVMVWPTSSVVTVAYIAVGCMLLRCVGTIGYYKQIIPPIPRWLVSVPKLKSFDALRPLTYLVEGVPYLISAICTTVCLRSDVLVLSWFETPAGVATYGVVSALAGQVLQLGRFAATATITAGLARGSTHDRSAMFKRAHRFFMLGVLVSACGFIVAAPPFVQFWLRGRLLPDSSLYALWAMVLLVMGHSLSFEGLVKTRTLGQGVLTSIILEAMANVTLSILFTWLWGAPGVILGTLVAHTLTNAWVLPRMGRQLLD